jgi:HlyD family secretion protein
MILIIVGVVVVAGGLVAWLLLSKPKLPPGFFGSNGRLEATELYVSAKYPGRIKEVLFNEGDTVEAGQVVARLDTEPLEEQLNQALAQITAAEAKIKEAQQNRNYVLAQVKAKQAEAVYTRKQYERSQELVPQGAVSQKEAEIDLARSDMTKADVVGAQAQATQTLSSIDAASADADAARAEANRLRAMIKDSVLVAPIRSRVQTRLAEPGEVLASGGRVYSLVNLADVYMYVFLPEKISGKLALGSEARIVLDAAPDYPIRATISYVSPVAQFTPKTVETAEERHNLTFRVKLQIDPARLRQFEPFVKVGTPGMGYVRVDNGAPWPARLEYKSVTPQQLGGVLGPGASK